MYCVIISLYWHYSPAGLQHWWVSSILPSSGRLLSNFYTPALLHLRSLHLPSTVWVSLWGAYLLAHGGGLFWLNRILVYDMSCPSQSTQFAEFHNVILITHCVIIKCANTQTCKIHQWSPTYRVVPPYPLIQYLQFTVARKKIGKLEK
jgi:hypothetical protein